MTTEINQILHYFIRYVLQIISTTWVYPFRLPGKL